MLAAAFRDLVVANRILAREGVVDAFGHVSLRHPERPDRYLLSCSRSPELVRLDDLIEFTLEGEPVDARGKRLYSERPIHGAIYEARPDVHAVVHNHSLAVIPFGVATTPLRPLVHVAGLMGAEVPIWDIRTRFGDTDLLVVTMDQGRDLAHTLGANRVVLMRGHGCAVTGRNLREAVANAIYTQVNAQLQMDALRLGEVNYLTPGEVARTMAIYDSPSASDRAWEYWRRRAGCDDL